MPGNDGAGASIARPAAPAAPSAASSEDQDAPLFAAREQFLLPDLCQAKALGVVVLVCQLLVLVLLFAGELSWLRFALLSLYVQWVGLCSAGLLCFGRRWIAPLGMTWGALASFLLVLGVTLAVSLVADRMLANLALVDGAKLDWQRIAQQLAIAAIITGLVLRYFYVQQRLRQQEQAELQARIQSLQSRIRPHFLFNSMNIIASLIAVDPETAEVVVEDLSALFRASLNEAGHQVSLQDELDLCQRYARIESLRLGERLQMHWQLAGGMGNVQLPLLSLQPLLENAIYHGIQPRPEGGTVSFVVQLDGAQVEICIRNPLPPDAQAGATQGNRMALANIRSRLAALYGDAASLTAAPEGDAFVTRLRLPVSKP